MPKRTLIDLTGKRVGRLVVRERFFKPGDKRTYWLCDCDCGNERPVRGDALKGEVGMGNAMSCGCLQKELAMERATTHGQSKTNKYKREWVAARMVDTEYRERQNALARMPERKKAKRAYQRSPDRLAYLREKRKTDIQFRIRHNIRTRIGKMIKRGDRPESAIVALGCPVDKLIVHIEKQFCDGMTWDNYGAWHIDHIIPLSVFDLADKGDFKMACHYTNMQPLWAEDNLIKRDKLPC